MGRDVREAVEALRRSVSERGPRARAVVERGCPACGRGVAPWQSFVWVAGRRQHMTCPAAPQAQAAEKPWQEPEEAERLEEAERG